MFVYVIFIIIVVELECEEGNRWENWKLFFVWNFYIMWRVWEIVKRFYWL